VKSLVIGDQKEVLMWVSLSKEMIVELVDDRNLTLCLQLDATVEDDDSIARLTFAEAVRKGSRSVV